MSELVMTISIAVQAVATIALVLVTYFLVKHTKALAKVSDGLTKIEEARDKRTQREKKLFDIQRAYELAEDILRINPGYFGAELFPGVSPREHSELLKRMELMSAQIDDSDTVQLLRELVIDVQNLEQGMALGEENRVKDIDKFGKFQGRLRGHQMHKWREQLSSNEES
ncbi:MAG: hypothetical protein NTZ35_01880 [Ignavibacteriales bacterium]|nr:hypothetical protein [Ignavibacteriales bacterium]